MKWRVPEPEIDIRGLGDRLCKKTMKHLKMEQGGCHGFVVDGGS